MIFRRKSAEEIPEQEQTGLVAPTEQYIGSVALLGASEAFVGRVDRLGKTINKFDQEWTSANNFISDTLTNIESMDMLDAGIAEYAHSHEDPSSGQRQLRRMRNKVSDRDYPEFVKAQVGLSRISAHQVMVKNASSSESSREIYRTSREHIDDIQRINGKWGTIAGTACGHMPTATRFYTRMGEIGKTLSPMFSRAVKYQYKIFEDMASFVEDEPDNARQLVESLLYLQNSDKREHQVLIKLLATEFSQHNDGSIIGYAVKSLEKLGKDGGLITEFLQDESGKNGSAEWLEFSRKIFTNLKGQGNFANYLASNRDIWPSKLTEDYQKFTHDYVSNKNIKLKKELESSVDPQLVTPTVFQVEQVFDRLMRQVIGAEPKVKAKQTQADKSRLTAQIMPATKNFESLKKELSPIWLQRLGKTEFEFSQGDELEKQINKIAQNSPHLQRLRNDLCAIIDRLASDPAGQGTTPISEVSRIKIGSERYRVMRISPHMAKGLSVPSANDCRVVYAIAGDNLAILGIFTSHSEYDSYIDSLK